MLNPAARPIPDERGRDCTDRQHALTARDRLRVELRSVLDRKHSQPTSTVPALVIVGRHDFITTVTMAEELVEHISAARLQFFEDSGHFGRVEEPEKFYQVVKQFVLNAP